MAHLNLTAAPDATSFASSSTSNSHVYDVFLNHRGPDVKKSLASHIYHRLKDHGLRVFWDQEELQEGENMTPQIEGAIRTASVQVAIFSPRYAESSWCLNELVLMEESMSASRSTIIPVFYDVNPSELRWTRGAYGVFSGAMRILQCILMCTRGENGGYARALHMLENKMTLNPQTNKWKRRYDCSTIEKWRNALHVVSEISGFELNECNGDNGQLVDKVIQQVMQKVSKTPLHVAKYPTGLDEKVKDVERMVFLQQQSMKARVVGIVGLGGVGKTTLAKEFFNRHRSNYDRSCFVFDVRENAAKNSLNSLQTTLLNDLALLNEQINNTHQGIEKIKRHVSSSRPRSLIVLDDVDHIDQLDALFCPIKDTINSGSLILITSRIKDVLTSSGIVESCIYKQTGLNPQHSQELFCSHAFDQTCPVIGFEELVEKCLDACSGLPLSLKVIGALLRLKDFDYWKALLHKISITLPTDIQSRLKISYDGLDEEEKHIFLDIACFFIGEDKDTAIRIWDGSGWQGWLGFRSLEQRCLVETDSQNCIIMHDHLRDLGRDLAEKEHPGCQLRLSRPTDNLLRNLSGKSPVRGIRVVYRNGPEQSFENLEGICNLSKLQLLRAEGDFVERVFSVEQLRPQLIYLRWEYCPTSSLPSSIPLKNLRVLQIQGWNLETMWQHEYQAPLQLRELYVNAPLTKFPKSIGKLKHLEKFVLHQSYLEYLPDEFCHMHSLKHVELKCCEEMRLLPASFGDLTNLQSLDLSECSTLQKLPDSVGSLRSLQSLDLGGCSTLQKLPDTVGNLRSLQSLHLGGCSTLQKLPDSVGNIKSLQSLHLGGCSALHTLPDSVGNLTSLLHLVGCSTLQTLPESFGTLTNLQSLHLNGCSTLQTLPHSLGNLTSLESLGLQGCSTLRTLPNSFGSLRSLQSLDLGGCSTLQMLPDSIGSLRSLQSLDLRGCSTLHTLPDSIGILRSLQSLHLGGCYTLQMLPESVGNLRSLQNLHLGGCSTLQMLPDSVGNLASLQSLHLVGCSTLKTLPESLGNLTSLQNLDLGGCSTLQRLPNSIGNLVSLHTLCMGECSTLHMLPDSVGNLRSLQSLDLHWCHTLQTLPDSVGNLSSLQSLDLCRCFTLKMLPNSIGHLRSLQSLDLSGCLAMWGLPDSVGNLTSLQSLDLRSCLQLSWVPASFGSLTNLENLESDSELRSMHIGHWPRI